MTSIITVIIRLIMNAEKHYKMNFFNKKIVIIRF